jgi:hypothetical protein
MPDAPLQSSLFEEDYLLRELGQVAHVPQVALTELNALYAALSQQPLKGELDLSRVSLTTESTEDLNHEIHERHNTQTSVAV